MWDLPGPGLEPVSPALAGGFLTTAPPGKSQQPYLKITYQEVVLGSTVLSDSSVIFLNLKFIMRKVTRCHYKQSRTYVPICFIIVV